MSSLVPLLPWPLPLSSQSYGASKAAAKEGFAALFLDKTGNSWEDRGDTFIKKPNKFYPLEIDYGTDEGAESAVSLKGVGSKSTLHSAVQDLVRLIFDVESMKKAMMEFEVCGAPRRVGLVTCGVTVG